MAPEYDQAWLNLGFCYERLNRPQDAVGAWQRAVEINPDSEAARHSLVVVLRDLGRSDEAALHDAWLKRNGGKAGADLN